MALSWRHWRDPEVLLVCGLGSGFLPKVPGTWGSALALLFWWWLLADTTWITQLAVTGAVFVVGVIVSHRVCARYGVHDDPAIVIDEFAGLGIALLGVGPDLLAAVAGFLLFRVFDILKPWPINRIDSGVSGGLGVMLDDLFAGALAGLVLQGAIVMLGKVV